MNWPRPLIGAQEIIERRKQERKYGPLVRTIESKVGKKER